MKKLLKILFIVLFIMGNLLYFGLNYAINNIFPYSIIRPERITPVEFDRRHPGNSTPEAYQMKWDDIKITVEDTLQLKGWFIYSKVKPALGTIILLHGIGSCKESQLKMAALFTAEGFNTLLYDARAHGESGGINCTFGYYEVKDVSSFLDSVAVRYPGSTPYGIYGHSLGASVGIMSAAADKRIVCGVFEAPFADMKEIVRDYFAKEIYFRINSIPDGSLKAAEKIAGFKAEKIKPAETAKSIDKPVMIVHGIQDKNVSALYGKRIFDNLRSRNKVWYPIFKGEHNNLNEIGGKNLRLQIMKFYKSFMALQEL